MTRPQDGQRRRRRFHSSAFFFTPQKTIKNPIPMIEAMRMAESISKPVICFLD
jgi:hypothetical protein